MSHENWIINTLTILTLELAVKMRQKQTMKRKNVIFTMTILTLLLSSCVAVSQDSSQQGLVDKLCKKWVIDSLEVKDMNRKFPAPANLQGNYTHFKKDGTFEGQDFGIVIKGKWKVDLEKMQIINYDMDNPQLEAEIVLTIVTLTENSLAITSRPMSGNQVVMYFKLEEQ